jgi:hypothetical protein
MARGPVLESRGESEIEHDPGEDDREWIPRNNQEETRSGVIGEYIGITSHSGFATPVWTDTRNGNQDTYGAIDASLLAVDGEAARAIDRTLVVAPNPAYDRQVGIGYRVPQDGWVDLQVFDVGGRKIRTLVDRNVRAGDYRFVWDGTDQGGREVAPGTYYIRFSAAELERKAAVQILP